MFDFGVRVPSWEVHRGGWELTFLRYFGLVETEYLNNLFFIKRGSHELLVHCALTQVCGQSTEDDAGVVASSESQPLR